MPDSKHQIDGRRTSNDSDLAEDDVLIAVMGPTGAGKSSLINLATQSNHKLKESGDEDSCTSTVDRAPAFWQNGRRVILYDTPGFDDSRMTNTEVLQIILRELEAQYKKDITLHGIIYVHPIDQPRVSGQARANFALMAKVCGDTSLKNLVLVTNRWGLVPESARREKFAKLLIPGSFLSNAVDRKAQILQNHPMPLLAQTELVDEKKPYSETSAGKESDKRLAEFQEKLQKQMEMMIAMAEKAKRDLDTEAEREMREEAAGYIKQIERLGEERRDADKKFADLLSQAQADAKAAKEREKAAKIAEAAAKARADAATATLGSITSGRKHRIMNVKYDRYVTCDDDERTVSGRRRRGYGRRWIFTKLTNGNWTIQSSSSERYLSTNSSGDVRARSKPQEWEIKLVPDEYDQFRLYNTEWDRQVLTLEDNYVGTPLSLEDRNGSRKQIFEIEED